MEKVNIKDIEACIAQGYQKVLKQNIDSKNFDFFLNGGNSIKAMELVNYLNKKFGYEVTIDAIFRHPSINTLALHIAQYLLEVNRDIEQLPGVEKVTQQLGIYLLSQQDLGGISYNMPVCYEIHGKIDFQRLKMAYRKIQERYDIFRTIFCLEDNELKELVFNEPTIEFQVFSTKFMNVSEVFHKFVMPFSLDILPLTRMAVWENNDKCYLFVDFHHIISDGISLEIFLGMLSEYYNSGRFDHYMDVPIKNIHILKKLEVQKKYWIDKLGNIEGETEIIGDFPRKARRKYYGNTIVHNLPKDLHLKVKELGKAYGCTEFMIYLSVYMILVSKYSMKQEILVGIPVAGRTSLESENALGMFINSLAIKGTIKEKELYADFLCEIKKVLIDAFLNQDYPFYQLISDLGLSGRISAAPLFNTFFIYQNYDHNIYFLDGKKMNEIRGLDKVSKFDLTLEIYADNNDPLICLEYSTELFKDSTAEFILTHYFELLRNIVAAPNTALAYLKCLSKEEELLITEKFNGSKLDKYSTMHFADLFEKNVERIPTATAIIFNEERISYKELNERGNTVASLLRKKMQGDNCIIPFISARGIEMIVGIIGINKADYAFVNLDYTLPIERIKLMLTECNAKFVLVGKINDDISKLISQLSIDFISLDMFIRVEENVKISRKSNSLSYIMYTSGTTGKPKGVMIDNSGLVAYSQYIGKRYNFTTNTTVLQSTTYTFDPFIIETMPALLYGSKIVVTSDDMVLDPAVLVQYMNDHAVNIADFCPTVLSRIANYLGQAKYLSIIISGGEILPNDLKDKVLNYGIRLFNHYGPTEITVDATIQECKLEKNVTLGSPIPFKKVVIVSNYSLVGIGIPGEIYVGGVGVARGYLNEKQSLSKVFILDKEGNKWYKTGDIGKWGEDGEITYLGRLDKQIKILGHRIELSEIEECIRCMNSIEDAVVIIKNNKLIAYYVCSKMVDELDLQENLKNRLPFYMIPGCWMNIKSMPYTINGKVDIHKLPALPNKLFELDEKPLSELEKQVTNLFMSVLGGKQVNKYDNFFRLGGNSLKAASLLNIGNCETQKVVDVDNS